MKSLEIQIEQISKTNGVPVVINDEIAPADLAISRSDQKRTSVALGKVFNRPVLFVSYDGENELRPLAFFSRISKLYPGTPVVLLASQLSVRDRREYLKNSVPFMTSEGEMFLPFIGTRLLAGTFSSSGPAQSDTFTSAEQRLALTILLVQLVFERRNDAKAIPDFVSFKQTGDRFLVTGGQRFVDTLGKRVGINNRVMFNRSANQLVERGILKYSGETKNREYSCKFDSRGFFKRIDRFLVSPLLASSNVRLDFDPRKLPFFNTMYTKLSGLSKVTMVSNNNDLPTFVVDRSSRRELADRIKKIDKHAQAVCSVWVSKYNLRGFNWLTRMVTDYPRDVMDPLHLYILFKSDVSERVRGEAEELIERIWNGDRRNEI